MKTALAFAALLLVVQDPQQPKSEQLVELKKVNGDSIVGAVVEVVHEKVKLRVPMLDGSMVVTNKLSDFEPASVLLIEAALNPPTGFDGHFAMAKKAAEAGLLPKAGTEARAAVAAAKGAPDFAKKQAEVRAWAAGALEKAIADAVAAGDLKQAKHRLNLLTTRLSDQRTEEQLEVIAASVEKLEAADKQLQTQKRQAKLDQKQREQVERQLKPIAENVEKGTKAYHDAMRKNTTGASSRLCEQAIDFFRKAHKALGQLVEKNPDDEHLADAATVLGKEIHDNAIAAALHAATMLCVQSDYKQAMEWAQKVLKFEPNNADAKAMVATITTAAAESGDNIQWGWTLGDLGKVGEGPKPRDR